MSNLFDSSESITDKADIVLGRVDVVLRSMETIFEDKNIEDKKIKIFTITEDEFVFLNIVDNAGGIPKNIIDKVFNPYFTTKEEGKGIGIGLCMSKQLVESVNNTIISVAVKDSSTIFTIKFEKK